MRPSAVSDALERLLPLRKPPVYLWSGPGIGKSSLVKQTADKLGLPVIDLRAVLLDPVDLRGLPHVNGDNRAHWCAPDFLPRDGAGVLFLDELAQAPPLVQSACLQLVLDRRIGEYELPDGWLICAASNRQEDRSGAHRLISALASRFVHVDLDVHEADWQAWASAEGIAPVVRAFVAMRPALLHDFDPSTGSRSFPCPRAWEFVSNAWPAVENASTSHQIVAGMVGEGASAEFHGFARIWQSLPDVGQIIANPSTSPVPSEPSVLFALGAALSERCRDAEPVLQDAVVTYLRRMPREFGVFGVLDAVGCSAKSKNRVAQCSAIRDWLVKDASFRQALASRGQSLLSTGDSQ